MKKITKSLIFYLNVIAVTLFFNNCKDDNMTGDIYPVDSQTKSEWLQKMNGDIQSLKNIVVAFQSEDSVTDIQIVNNGYKFEFLNTPTAEFVLDPAVYDSPLIGVHKIDHDYYWTQIVGTGTSATTLLKDINRKNYKVMSDGVTPQFDISSEGSWVVVVGDERKDVYNPEGKKFRAMGTRSLFQSVTFDTDSNVTIVTNEIPARTYLLPKYRPFTFTMLTSVKDTLQVASGFTIPLDFASSGIFDFEYVLPKAWSASHTFAVDKKSGSILVTAPTGMETDYEDSGSIEITAVNAYGDELKIVVPVKCEIGLVNYASVEFSDLASGVNIASASFVFADESLTNERTVSVVKASNKYRVMLPEGFPILKKANFTTIEDGTFTYHFAPQQTLHIGDQTLSLAAPQLLSYWQGGIIIDINETLPLSGIAKYNISGTVMAPQIGPKVPWYPNGNVDVTTAMSTTDGATNTAEIIKALGGPGTTSGYIARWAIRVRNGGYADWYLGVANEYMAFNSLWQQDNSLFNQKMNAYGGVTFVAGTHNMFWTSENISATQARAFDIRNGGLIVPGTKVYGCYGLAFRKFN